jgi:hypothetical protein
VRGDEAAIGTLARHLYARVPERDLDGVEAVLLRLVRFVRRGGGHLVRSADRACALLRAWIRGARLDSQRADARYAEILQEHHALVRSLSDASALDAVLDEEAFRKAVRTVWGLKEPVQTVMVTRMTTSQSDAFIESYLAALFDRDYALGSVRSMASRATAKILEEAIGDPARTSERSYFGALQQLATTTGQQVAGSPAPRDGTSSSSRGSWSARPTERAGTLPFPRRPDAERSRKPPAPPPPG